jgi:hypothetical protein
MSGSVMLVLEAGRLRNFRTLSKMKFFNLTPERSNMTISPFAKLRIFSFALLAGTFFCWMACDTIDQSDEAALIEIVEQFQSDQNHAYMRNFIPTLEDCQVIFKKGAAQKVFEFSEMRFAGLDQLPDDAMKPVSENPSLEIQSATKQELLAGQTNDLEEGYLKMAEHLKDGMSIYGFHYLNVEGEVEKSRAAFFKAGEKWIFIPRPFMAFE